MNGLDKAGSTPLHWAAHGGHMDCLQVLLTQPKCEINVQVRKKFRNVVLCMCVCVCVDKNCALFIHMSNIWISVICYQF